MDSSTNVTTPTPEQAPVSAPATSPAASGSSLFATVAAGILVLLALAFGGWYVWQQQLSSQEMVQRLMNEPDETAAQLSQQSSSDAAADIEADLDATNLGSLDADVSSISAQ